MQKNAYDITVAKEQAADALAGVNTNATNISNLRSAVQQNTNRINELNSKNEANEKAITQNANAIRQNTARIDSKVGITVSTITLAASGWNSKQQTVTVSGLSDSAKKVDVAAAPASREAYSSARVVCTGSSGNKLTFSCLRAPTEDLTVNICVYE